MAKVTTTRLSLCNSSFVPKSNRAHSCPSFKTTTLKPFSFQKLFTPQRGETLTHGRTHVASPISMSLQQLQDVEEEDDTDQLDDATVCEIEMTPEFFGACFEDDYRLETSAWPEDLVTTTDYRKIENFVSSAHSLVRRWLPSCIISQLEQFIHDPSMAPVLVLRGLPVDKDLPPTGPDGPASKAGKFLSETWLVGVSRIVGQVFTYDALRMGRSGMGLLVRDIYPACDKLDEVSDFGSRKLIDYHVNFLQVRPESFPHVKAYYGLRGDPAKEAHTLVCSFKKLYSSLHPTDIRILREQKITWKASSVLPPFSEFVIEGPKSDPKFNIFLEDQVGYPGFDKMVHGRPDAVAAYKRVKEAARMVGAHDPKAQVLLGAGDLMLINQNRAAHGRNAYAAKCDGNDRWMQHVYINEGAIWEPTGLAPWPIRSLPIVPRN